MGDGALVYFGYPEAYEDSATRAILSGQALVEAIVALRCSAPKFPAVRVGIATGTVVVGELIGEGGNVEEGLRRSEQALAVIRAKPTAKYQLPMLPPLSARSDWPRATSRAH
jgi:hypothetical protein